MLAKAIPRLVHVVTCIKGSGSHLQPKHLTLNKYNDMEKFIPFRNFPEKIRTRN